MLDPSSRELDRQRKAIQLATDFDYPQRTLPVELQIRPHSLCLIPEERRRRRAHDVVQDLVADLRRGLKRRDRKLVLATQPQRASTGYEERNFWAAKQQRIDEWRRRRQVLEGVQHN